MFFSAGSAGQTSGAFCDTVSKQIKQWATMIEIVFRNPFVVGSTTVEGADALSIIEQIYMTIVCFRSLFGRVGTWAPRLRDAFDDMEEDIELAPRTNSEHAPPW